jgi:hypothetical protein
MRHFHSYGPVDCEAHFCVKREELIAEGVEQLIGQPEKGGHYFTIWAPRQTGKTWLMRQIRAEISKCYPDYTVYSFSLGNLRGMSYTPSEKSGDIFLPRGLSKILERELPEQPVVKDWDEFQALFSKDQGLWKNPLILLIDEVDTTPPSVIRFTDRAVSRNVSGSGTTLVTRAGTYRHPCGVRYREPAWLTV